MEHASLPLFVRDAHSLWLETLAELGMVGFLLLTLAIGAGFVAALRRLRRAGSDRPLIAAMAGVLAAFVVAAGIDWMWELTHRGARGHSRAWDLGGACNRGGTRVGSSQFAVRRPPAAPGRALRRPASPWRWRLSCVLPCRCCPRTGWRRARLGPRGVTSPRPSTLPTTRARSSPGRPSPYLQLALLEEQAGHLGAANRRIDQALERDRSDWSIWLVAARVQTKAGFIGKGRRSLRQAERLNPKSQLLAALRERTRKPSSKSD